MRLAYYCKVVATNCVVNNLKKVDAKYKEAKQAEVSKEEERKRKIEETKENWEREWQVAHFDDMSDGETTQEPAKGNQPTQMHQDREHSDDKESIMGSSTSSKLNKEDVFYKS